MDEDDEFPGEVIVCAGPPVCLFEDDAAIQNAIDGCPKCRRIRIGEDGSETEWQERAN